MRQAKIIGSAQGYIRQTGSAHLASPISAELYVVNRHLLSQTVVPGETRLAKLAPPIWLREGGSAYSYKQEEEVDECKPLPSKSKSTATLLAATVRSCCSRICTAASSSFIAVTQGHIHIHNSRARHFAFLLSHLSAAKKTVPKKAKKAAKRPAPEMK